MGHVFISYARKDSKFVEVLRQKLREADFEVWTDSIVRPGNDWRQEIDEAIRNAFVLLVIITPNAKTSEYITYEWAFALGLGIKVIPVVVKPMPLHPRLEFLQHVDFTPKRGEDYPWERLIQALHDIREDTRNPTVAARPTSLLPDLGTARMNAPGVWLVVRRGPQPDQMWNLNKDNITLGREITNDIVINDHQISRRHVRFYRKTPGHLVDFSVEDLGSSNGTFVNRVRIVEPKTLKDGDIVDLGESVTLLYKVIVD